MNLQTLWRAHGTKLIGFAVAAIGSLEFVDASTLKLIETALGPKVGTFVSHAIMIVSGLATAYRGFQNSRTATSTTAPPPNVQPSTPPGGSS